MAAALILFHFFLPFFMLLMRCHQGQAEGPSASSRVIILLMRFVDVYWLCARASPTDPAVVWITRLAFIGIGGLWLAAFIWQLKGQTIIPIHETWVEEAIREGALTRNA
jgi:hypothetical protein